MFFHRLFWRESHPNSLYNFHLGVPFRSPVTIWAASSCIDSMRSDCSFAQLSHIMLPYSNILYFTLLFSLFVFVSAAGQYYILIDWVWGNSKFGAPETLTIDRGEAEVNSQGRGDNKLVIPEYTVYEYFIIPKNIRLIFEWSPQNDKDQKNHASFASILHYKSEYCLMDIVMLFPQSFIRIWFFWESRLQHKCTWWKFWNFLKF